MYETPEARRWVDCVHEAGHAAAALLLGFEGVGAVVFDDAEGGGGIATTKDVATANRPPDADYEPDTLDDRCRGKDWPALLRDATFAAAGCAAEDLIFHPERFESTVSGADALQVHAAARAAIPTACDGLVELTFADLAAARARCLLEPVLWRVKLAAKELNRRGRMTAEDIILAMYPDKCRRDTSSPQADSKA